MEPRSGYIDVQAMLGALSTWVSQSCSMELTKNIVATLIVQVCIGRFQDPHSRPGYSIPSAVSYDSLNAQETLSS